MACTQVSQGATTILGILFVLSPVWGGTAETAAPLYALCKKGRPWVWERQHQQAFEALKSKLISLPMLSHPDPNLPFDVHVDASNVGLGAVLVQAGRPVAFASRTLTSTEQNCSATEKECLAVVWALDYFHPYVYGATVTVYSEHAALKWIMSRQAPRGRIARWTMTLLQYDFAIVHRHGVENKDADALSRLQQNPHQVQAVITQETLRYWQEVDPAIKAIKANIKAPYQLIDGVVFLRRRQTSCCDSSRT